MDMNKEEGVKERIVDTAWKLFHEKGFEDTTLNDIIGAAHISKGSFYYYFDSKDTLLNTLSIILDRHYMELEIEMRDENIENCFDQLMYLNYRMHSYMDENIGPNLIGNLYSAQIVKKEGGNLLDRNRYYYKLMMSIVEEGQKRGEITDKYSVSVTVNMYSLVERALVTDWCMCNGTYPLGDFSREWMPILFRGFKGDK